MRTAIVAFAALLALSPAIAVAGVEQQTTVIHPGDQISVQVYGNQMLTQNVTVLDDGTIDYPLIGRIHVGGRTPTQAAGVLRRRLTTYMRHPVVTVAITQLGQPWVLVLGDVKNPGKYQLRSNPQLTDAIAAAGGIADVNGAFPDARVADPDGQVHTVSLQSLLHNGDMSQDVSLGEGSIVYVPGPIAFNVDVVGAVDHPGEIQVHQGDRLSVAIAMAGDSANAHADLNHIRVVRTLPNGQQTTQEINLYDAFNKGDAAADIPLQKGDVVYVPQTRNPTNWIQTSPFLYYLGLLTRIIP